MRRMLVLTLLVAGIGAPSASAAAVAGRPGSPQIIAQATQADNSAATTVRNGAHAAAEASARAGIPLWVWFAVAVVVLLLLIALFARRRRSQAVIRSRLG